MTNPIFAAYKNPGSLVRDAQPIPAWSPDGQWLGFMAGPPAARSAWLVELATGVKRPLCDVDTLRTAVHEATGLPLPDQGWPFDHFNFVGAQRIAFAVGAVQVTFDLQSQSAELIPGPNLLESMSGVGRPARVRPRTYKRFKPLMDPIDAPDLLSPDGRFFLSIEDHNVALRSTYDARTRKLTHNGTADWHWHFDWTDPMLSIVGMDVPTTNWSPSSRRVAAYLVDQRGVDQVPTVQYFGRSLEVDWHNAALAGGTIEQYSLYVLDVLGGAPLQIDLGETRDTYPVFAGWLNDETELLIFRMSRDCRQVDVLVAELETGQCRLLFSERGESFIRIHHDVYYGRKLGLHLTLDESSLLWLSERDGWKHIYQYGRDGALLTQLTSGDWAVDEIRKLTEDHVYFYAYCNPDRPYDRQLCRVALTGGPVEQLTQATGKHTVIFAPNAAVFLDVHSAPERPPVTELVSLDGHVLNAELSRADISPLEQIGHTPAQQFTVKAADGKTDLWGVMYKPHDFDPAKKYPVIEYIYGGPQMALAEHGFIAGFSVSASAPWLAQLGCVTVVLDARGTPGRNKAFHDAIYGNWSSVMAADHAGAIRQLAERHDYIDADRVGIMGFSWGGGAAFRCLAEAPDVYSCAVCAAPGFDPYSSLLYECYLGLPQHNPDGYRQADAMALAPRVRGELMLIAGTSDMGPWDNAVKMSEALIRAGKSHEFVVMPEQGHGYISEHEAYYDMKFTEFFCRHLEL